MSDRELLMKIIEGQARHDERLTDLSAHITTITTKVDTLQTWKDRWGGALAAGSGIGAVLGVLLTAQQVYAWVIGG
jgi:hypothetical protein